MKFSLWSGLGLLSVSAGVLAAPHAAPATAGLVDIERRSPVDSAYAIASQLFTEIKAYTGAINETATSVSKTSSAEEKDAAKVAAGKDIEGMTSAILVATAQIKALPTSSSKLEARQATGPAALAAVVAEIILEISGALNNIIADLGLDPLLSFLNPLLASLSGLLLSLEVVVNDLLALVQALLDGLLTGLAAGLAGIIL